MNDPQKDPACTDILLYLDCCSVPLAGDVDPDEVMRRLGEAMRTGDVVKIKICWRGRPVDAWIKPSNSQISYIGDPDVRVT
jgi:hypothetical protein